MGYLTNRGYLRDLEDLRQHLPEGWTFNTPCFVSYPELEDFREVRHNVLFEEMVETGRSINQVLNGSGWGPCGAEILREQKVAAQSWAEALEDEINGRYCHHPHQSGTYIHTMWSRANDRSELSQAIWAVDMCKYSPPEFKDRFCNWVRGMDRKRQSWGTTESSTWQHGGCQGGGVARGIDLATQGLFASTTDRRVWRRDRGKAKGTTLADKRRGIAHAQAVKRCKAVWR